MRTAFDPFSFLVTSVAGWMNQHQHHVINYLIEENRVLREQIGNRRLRFSDDFFTVEVWTPTGLQRFVVLFFMELSTRRVEIGGIASRANGLWMAQIARTVTDGVDRCTHGNS